METISLYKDPSAITPLMPETEGGLLSELAITLLKKSSALSNALNSTTKDALVKLIEPMNSYYSNLIEGHNTNPLDIERALKKDYSKEPDKKLLQLESTAHIYVQGLMKDELKNEKLETYSPDFIKWLHKEFYKKMPKEFHYTKTRNSDKIEIIPGELRIGEVEVGRHIAPAAASLDKFLMIFSGAYTNLNKSDSIKRIIAIAASHHRLAWIHPFQDGNGRVVRLFSEALFIREGIDGGGLWSISRGLAFHNKDYYSTLNNADQKRLNDYDGHGNLSNRALVEFCEFFLKTAIDQVEFMTKLLEIDSALGRISSYVNIMVVRKELKPEARFILEEAFLKGKIARGETIRLTGKSENTARKITKELIEKGLLISKSDDVKTPLYINFPVKSAPYLFPKLYPKDIEISLAD
jgi:Fic family protein